MTTGVSSGPLVIAHRGASAREKENTVAAFRAAAALGADWVELDVRRTSDGRLAVHHDAALSDGRLIVDVPAADLPADVPDLVAALDACGSMGVNVEIKNHPRDPDFDPDAVISRTVAGVVAGRSQPILVSSFDPGTLGAFRRAGTDVPTALLTFGLDDPEAVVEEAVRAGHAALHPFDGTVDGRLVARCHDRDLQVNVWTVDDPGRIAELVALGVDGIVTNVPDVARQVLRDGAHGA